MYFQKHMKRFSNILILNLLVTSSIYGQDISSKFPETRERVKEINLDKSFEVVTLENEEFLTQMTDGGGKLTGHFMGGQIQKIIRSIGLSSGTEIYKYYFVDGKLIFVDETLNEFIYNESSGKFDYTKTELSFIGSYYFQNNKLLDSETKGHNRFEDDSIDIEATLIKEMTECLKKLEENKE